MEPAVDGGTQRLALVDLLLHALEEDDVGVGRDADRDDQTGDARQGEVPTDRVAEQDDQTVDEPRERQQADPGLEAERPVVHGDEEHDEEKAERSGQEARPERLPAEGRGDGLDLRGLELDRQGAGVQHEGEILRLLLGEVAADVGGPRVDPLVADDVGRDLRRRLHLGVEDDADLAGGRARRVAGERAGEVLPGLGRVALEPELDVPGAIVVDDRRGAPDRVALQRRLVQLVLVAVYAGIGDGLVGVIGGGDRRGGESGVAGGDHALHPPELELGRLADELQQLFGVPDARDLDQDVVAALP